MNLNIGSSDPRGKYKGVDWINLDICNYENVNVLGSGLKLPFKENSFDLIHCVHVLEHVTREKNQIMLDEMCRVVKPNCEVMVEVPDFQEVIDLLHQAFKKSDTHKIHQWTTSIYGKNERDGMAHYWGFTAPLLCKKFHKAGFSGVNPSNDMISDHYSQEPVLLVIGKK